MTLLCGRFEGVDQRLLDHHAIEEISLGDFVLTGGEIAAQAAETFTLRRLEVRTAVIAGDHVAPEVDWTGTPAVDLGEFRAGERVVLRGASFFTISGDRLVRSWISVERPDSRQRISGP